MSRFSNKSVDAFRICSSGRLAASHAGADALGAAPPALLSPTATTHNAGAEFGVS